MARRPTTRTARTPGVPAAADTPSLFDDAGDPTWSVPELGEAIGLRMRTAFPDELWVRGVIRNLNPGRRGGTVWFDLVEPAAAGDLGRPPVASLSVVLQAWDMVAGGTSCTRCSGLRPPPRTIAVLSPAY